MKNRYKDYKWLYNQYWKYKLSEREIAKKCGRAKGTIKYWMDKYEIPRRENRKAIVLAGKKHRREKHPNWKGGRIHLKGDDYIYVLDRNHPRASKQGYVAEHLLVAEKILGRPLKKNEYIHHINGAKQDNNPTNLYIYNSWKNHKIGEATFNKLKKELMRKNIVKFKNGKYYISREIQTSEF